MRCWHPDCTGVHDNSRYRELCPRSLDGKRDRDQRYSSSLKGLKKRLRNRANVNSISLESAYAELRQFEEYFNRLIQGLCHEPPWRLAAPRIKRRPALCRVLLATLLAKGRLPFPTSCEKLWTTK